MTAVNIPYLLWIALTTITYWGTPARYRVVVVGVSTAAFLASIAPVSLLIFLISGIFSIWLIQAKKHQYAVALTIALTVILISSKLLPVTNLQDPRSVPLLFGISFYSLRIIHLLVETTLDNLRDYTTTELFIYLFFPPIIAAGPIQRIDSFNQINPNKFDPAQFSQGLQRILHGVALVVLVHNIFVQATLIPFLQSLSNGTTPAEWIHCLEYGLTLYLYFSAFSSIAIGYSLLLGYQLDENFNWPFLRSNLVEFWRNWHISLSNFCKNYIFTGVLATTRSVPLAFIASMLAIGLWHALSWNFMLWGFYHGVGILVTHTWLSSRSFNWLSDHIWGTLLSLLGWAITFSFVIAGFAFTRHNTLAESLHSWSLLLGLQ